MQEWVYIHKSIDTIHHINTTKDKNYMLISIDAEKAFHKIPHPFIIKNYQQNGYGGNKDHQHN